MPLNTSYQSYDNWNPFPQSGVMSPHGAVPGALSPVTPSRITSLPNPSADLSAVMPGMSKMNSAISQNILDQLGGNISTNSLAALRNAANSWGVGSGLGVDGGAGLMTNKLFGNVLGFSENQINKGIQNYNQTIPTVSGTQTLSPALQIQVAQGNQNAENQANQFNSQIAATNATNAAAPNPATAHSYAQQLFDQYLQSMRGPGGGTGGFGGFGNGVGGGGGTGTFSSSSGWTPNGGEDFGNFGWDDGGVLVGGGQAPAPMAMASPGQFDIWSPENMSMLPQEMGGNWDFGW